MSETEFMTENEVVICRSCLKCGDAGNGVSAFCFFNVCAEALPCDVLHSGPRVFKFFL